MFDYIAEGQMTLFDFIGTEYKFAPVIDDLSADIKAIFLDRDCTEKYEIWEHVPQLGYRYSAFITIKEQEYDDVVQRLKTIEKAYANKNLEVSIMQTPCFTDKGDINLFISTLWKDKERAKNG